jgi:hypothetical protein
MPNGPQIVLALKVLVGTVTVLLLASLVALLLKRPRLHGQINTVFFVLTVLTVIGFEGLLQWGLKVRETFDAPALEALHTHLWFSVPSALLLPAMIVSGKMRRKRLHLALAAVFAVLWTGTVITGFGLPN